MTVAPGVTFWDAGELIAAVQTFGVPHPPGTPLFVALVRAWRLLLGALPTAVATNLASAACTAAAGAALAWLIARRTGDRGGAVAAAIAAGTVSTVWSNATETDVYAASLLLAMLMLLAAARMSASGAARGETRWLALLAYVMALAVPLHLSALVAGPAAITLAVQGARDGAWRRRDLALLGAAFIAIVGIGLASWPLVAAGAALLALGAARGGMSGARRAVAVALAILAGVSPVFIMLVRARHHPAIDAGAATDWPALWASIGRRQYGGTPLWPRQAPWWIQLGNIFEYADWQVALGMARGVAPALHRTPFTLVFAGLAVAGGIEHRRRDARSWRAWGVLLLSATVGLAAYMNFKAGASFGYGVLPAGTAHEVRDRAYFFALAFWAWGAWAGLGAVALARRIARGGAPVGIAVAALPIVLNWRATDRQREPAASVPHAFAAAVLWSAPPGAVLVTHGDNDSFPLWYLQRVERVRPDVTVVCEPLLGASWYRSQIARRSGLLPRELVGASASSERLLRAVAGRARAEGRPVTAAITTGRGARAALGDGSGWVLDGLVYRRAENAGRGIVWMKRLGMVDTIAAARFVKRFGGEERWRRSARAPAADPAPGTFAAVMGCPGAVLAVARGTSPADSLDSHCKL